MGDTSHRIHWSDLTAQRIIRENQDKQDYVLASGITPSGTVHFGNFREVITVDLVARALRDAGKNVRFIFSWDDYDTFRKIPKNMPKQDELEKFMFQPIVDTPDPFEKEKSYAAHQERYFEGQLTKVGVDVEFLYQADKYRAGTYNEAMIKTLKAKDKIAEILNEHRKEPLATSWLPISVYCDSCNTDHEIKDMVFDGEKTLTYACGKCGHQGTLDLTTARNIKLPWRMDWPMRWAYEKVDFEPGGKDHSSQGGSYSTAKEIVKEVYDWRPPTYLQYDFVSIKGGGGKMSSSSGEVITVNDVLEIYEPEMVRWIFASYKTNVDFSVSFDLDVIKTYEDYDRQERLAFGVDEGNEKKVRMAKRVFELSQVEGMPEKCPIQPSFRHLTNILQIFEGDIDKCRDFYKEQITNERDERRFKQRAQCAKNWLAKYAPEDFKFQVNSTAPAIEMDTHQKAYVDRLRGMLEGEWENLAEDKDLHEKMYEIIHDMELKPADVFPVLYQLLISKPKGPKLAGFIRTIGKERVTRLFS